MVLKQTDLVSFIRMIDSGKKLICVGAGAELKRWCKKLDYLNFFDKISIITDNFSTEVEINGIHKKLITPADFAQGAKDLSQYVFLITIEKYYELFEQLNSIPELAETDCYILKWILHVPHPYSFSKTEARIIPKTIHYVWFGGKELTRHAKNCIASWERFAPDFKIQRWDESNYDVRKHPYMEAAYNMGKFAFASDYARLDVIYKYGGVYFDADVELLSELDPLLGNHCFLAQSIFGVIATGLGFGAVAKFPLLKEMRDYYDDIHFLNADGTLNLDDNGVHQTKVALKYGFLQRNELQAIAGATVFPTDVLSPLNVEGLPLSYTDNTIAVHNFNASWMTSHGHNVYNSRRDLLCEFYNKYFLRNEPNKAFGAHQVI